MDDKRAQRADTIDKLALTLESSGFPKNIARVYSALILAEGEGLSTSQLMEDVHTSKASITGAMQFLTGVDLVERYSVRGSRETHYRVLKGKWGPLLARKLGGIAYVRQVVEDTLNIAETDAARERLKEMHDVYSFFEDELNEVMVRWDKRMKEEK